MHLVYPHPPKKKIGISIVANVSWVSQLLQEFINSSNERFQGGGVNKVHYGRCENGELHF